ncbi:galactose-3-O-sulfotransferase 3-like [Tubulanus polymorphus]|uniref:galactose-3-O-sulfotransferase 3-like n=1 Tax=Tubulanus polymorphus TaxID=672921 RepID=UPI003DA52C1F
MRFGLLKLTLVLVMNLLVLGIILLRRRSEVARARKRVYFLKVYESGSTTVGGVLARYADKQNLNFIFHKMDPLTYGTLISWPGSWLLPEAGRNGGVDILTSHIKYDETKLKTILHSDPEEILSVAIIENPWSQFLSAFETFKVAAEMPDIGSSPNPVLEYLSNFEKHRSRITAVDRRRQHRRADGKRNYAGLRNLLITQFGGSADSAGFPLERSYFNRFVELINREFSLVMILEYFYESLVLFRRIANWRLEDILFQSFAIKNRRQKRGGRDRLWPVAEQQLEKRAKTIHDQYSADDYEFYRYFNRSFWEKVRRENAADFYAEVDYFRHVNERVLKYCDEPESDGPFLVSASPWNLDFEFTKYKCVMLNMDMFDHMESKRKY